MARVETADVQAALEKLSGGQVLTYKLAETFGGEFAHIQLNPEPKGKKYFMTLEKSQAGKPTGKKSVFMKHNDAKFVAKWINSMWGETLSAGAASPAPAPGPARH